MSLPSKKESRELKFTFNLGLVETGSLAAVTALVFLEPKISPGNTIIAQLVGALFAEIHCRLNGGTRADFYSIDLENLPDSLYLAEASLLESAIATMTNDPALIEFARGFKDALKNLWLHDYAPTLGEDGKLISKN